MITRSEKLFQNHLEQIYRRTDRMFAVLMVIQYFFGIGAAILISPRTWIGTLQSPYLHIQTAVFLGALILAAPITLAILMPGKTITRQVIAIGQMLDSALLVHLMGGRPETHFHIFGSLAFLGFYRDWRVLVTASVVVSLDHFFRGNYWPESVYGVLNSSPWRWVEHSAWILFEDIFIGLAGLQSIREMREVADRRAYVEQIAVERGRDIHLLQETKEQLNQALHSKNSFMSICGHELKTPLTSLSLQAQITRRLLAADNLSREKIVKLVDQTDAQVKRLLRLVQDMLDHSRIQLGKLPIAPEPLDAVELVREVVDRYQAQAEAEGSPIFLEVPEAVQARWDRFRIEQVLTNLISNAIKYGQGKPIEVSLIADSERATLRIRDNGLGIRAEDRERVFQQFERVESTAHIAGLGLGLYISKTIIERHGGRLLIEESDSGSGSVFTVELPLLTKIESRPGLTRGELSSGEWQAHAEG